MAKQIRYGAYADFKPEKMVTAELACVVSGDPAVSDGRSVYVCFTPGVVKRLTTYADFERELNAMSDEIRSQFTQDIKDAIQDALDAKNAAETFVEQKGQEIDGLITETQKTTSDFVQQAQNDVNTAVTSANASKQAADEATQKALDAADKANEAAGGEIGEKTVTFESDDNLTPASYTTMSLIASGGKLKDYIRSFTTAVKNIRYLFKVLGSSDISKIGDGTVTNALATLMADKLNKTDIVNDLLSTATDKALSAAMGKQLQDAVSKLNTDTGKIFNPEVVNGDLFEHIKSITGYINIVRCVPTTLNTPYAKSLTSAAEGIALIFGSSSYTTVLYISIGTNDAFMARQIPSGWGEWYKITLS